MPASSRILSCNHGILSSTSYLPAARFCFPQEAPLFVENRSDSFQAIPHNSKCRYGERGAADAKPKAQIILDAAKVSAASGGNSEPKQGQRSQSARGFCPRSTMRVPQPDIIEHFGNADAVPQPPERCLSHKAGIVRCCLIVKRQGSGHCGWPIRYSEKQRKGCHFPARPDSSIAAAKRG